MLQQSVQQHKLCYPLRTVHSHIGVKHWCLACGPHTSHTCLKAGVHGLAVTVAHANVVSVVDCRAKSMGNDRIRVQRGQLQRQGQGFAGAKAGSGLGFRRGKGRTRRVTTRVKARSGFSRDNPRSWIVRKKGKKERDTP